MPICGKEGKMNEKELFDIISAIRPADMQAIAMAEKRQAMLAKPPGSLGGLEDIAIRVSGMSGKVFNTVDKSCVAVFCADNGVVCEGVASAPQSVTMAQTINFTRRLTGVGALAESFGSELLIVDLGVKEPISRKYYTDVPLNDTHKIVDRRIRPETGETGNISVEDAMTLEEAVEAIGIGIEMADSIYRQGFEIMGVGEMGIGNTTTGAALLSAITGRSASETVGRGGGVNDEGYGRKKEIVDKVSAPYQEKGGILAEAGLGTSSENCYDIPGEVNAKSRQGAAQMIEALARMGGFDICGMTGAFLGAARNRMPVVIDGYISVVAALAAYIIAPASLDYMIASHKSFERGYALAVETLKLKPFMALDMRLGEGSGCPIAFKIIKGACDVMSNMATFDEAAINDDYLEEVRSREEFQK